MIQIAKMQFVYLWKSFNNTSVVSGYALRSFPTAGQTWPKHKLVTEGTNALNALLGADTTNIKISNN